MALLKTIPDKEVMKKYLEEDFIRAIVEKHKNLLSWSFVKIKRLEAEHVSLLSAQSYLVKYTVTIIQENGQTYTMVLRGNRISPEAAAMWQHLYAASKQENLHAVPTPLEFFPQDNFMLYEELQGKTLRDYDDKYSHLKFTSPLIAERIAWIHGLPLLPEIGTHDVAEEKLYWQSVIEKINIHHPEKPEWLDETVTVIHEEIIKKLATQTLTLCHNDYQASNIIYNEKSKHVGIIDFGNSTIYTPSLDCATHLVHLSVMTTKHLSQYKIRRLQKLFLKAYLRMAPENIKQQVIAELPLYIARVATDIIATTAVALGHTKNPYRILIPKILLPVVKHHTELALQNTHSLRDLLIRIKK